MAADTEIKQVRDIEQERGNRQQFVTFRIGKETYGILVYQVKEIIKPRRITHVPNTEGYVIGVINLRGQIVPVVDLKKKLNLEDRGLKENLEERIITVEVNEALIGIKVDEVSEVIWLDEDTIEPPPEVAGGIRQEYLRGVGRTGDELLVLVDLKSLLFAEGEEGGAQTEGGDTKTLAAGEK